MNAPGHRGRVVVIGGGVGGLAAAYRAQQNGFAVTLLEASDRIGGKAFTMRHDGYFFERGASILPSAYDAVISIIREIEMGDALVPGGSVIGFAKNDGIHYMDSAHLFRDAATTRLLSFKSKLLMTRLMRDGLRMRNSINYENLSLAAEYDTETAAEYCKRRLNDEIRDYIVDGTLRGMLGTEAKDQSVVDFFFCFSRLLGTQLYTLKDGIDSYPKALARHVSDIRLGARVEGIEERDDGVHVHWRDASGGAHREEADGCIVAVNAHLTAKLFAQLDAESRSFLAQLRYTDAITVNAALSKPPKDVPASVIQIPNCVDRGLFALTLEHHKCPTSVPPGKGGMGYYLMSHWSQELMDADDEKVKRDVIEAGNKVLPGVDRDITFMNVNRWSEVVTYNAPGTYRRLAAFIQRIQRHRRVKLAGDYFSVSNLNTATTAGVRAARELAATLSPEHQR